jgi:hypothetical protein
MDMNAGGAGGLINLSFLFAVIPLGCAIKVLAQYQECITSSLVDSA